MEPQGVAEQENQEPAIVSGVGGAALTRAISAVIQAFQLGEPKYTWRMLFVLYTTTGRKAIIEECQRYCAEINAELKIAKVGQELTTADKYMRNRSLDITVLQEKCEELYTKIMLLFDQYDITKFLFMNNRPPTRITGLGKLDERMRFARNTPYEGE